MGQTQPRPRPVFLLLAPTRSHPHPSEECFLIFLSDWEKIRIFHDLWKPDEMQMNWSPVPPPNSACPRETPTGAHRSWWWEREVGQSGRRADARTGLLGAAAPALQLGTDAR